MSAAGFLDHLTDSDLALLAQVAAEGSAAGVAPGDLRAQPERAMALLGEPHVFEALFHPTREPELLTQTSPFLVFACLVERAARELRTTSAVLERFGGRRRIPVFDAYELREFVAAPPRRLFLAELLTSYTRVASGAVWVRQRRRWRRRRFSELDIGQLMQMLDVVPAAERPGVYRRAGDLALFLTGVFPDACERVIMSTSATGRALRAADPGPQHGEGGGLAHLERFGARCYHHACATAAAKTAALAIVQEVADEFSRARRVLNFITDRHLFASRDRWFSPPA